MAENISASTPSSMASAPQPAAGAQNQQYETAQGNGQTNPSHMPPPPRPPVIIPQNTNPIPTAMTSPMSGNMMSPTSAGGYVRRAAPEPNKRALYVGGLDPRVTEDILKQIFETTGHVVSVKIIPDKNVSDSDTSLPRQFRDATPTFNSKGYNYGFVEFDDPGAAERAMQTLNGRRIHQSEIRVNWAYQGNNTNKEDTSNHFHIFVGDLSNEVNDEILLQAFSAFGTISEARVMWDMKTGRSRGYGFVAFRDRVEADKALNAMDGEWLGSRAIRCNWANQKGQPSISQQQAMAAMGMTPTTPFGHHHFPTQGIQSYDMVATQTPQWQTTCYVGNLTPYTTQNDLIPLFQNFGYVLETRLQADRGFAFVKMDSHENAAMAICQLNGYNVNGRPLKCSWGKDRPPTGQFDNFTAPQANAGFNNSPAGFFPQYGGPQNPMNQGPAPAGRGWDQQGNNFGGPGMPGQGYPQGPQGNAGGYGRGQPMSPSGNWDQSNNNFNGGYQA
ncbi:RNA recognition motif domain eukaryote [Penicillium pulvis]|uniref:RNA recognition motif domain eukaryote n=1 Tax=Penicillium pulvis TaxID=1562058 RepID=UPI0025470695|nr:RNA recognition motif domain eukaryote [Penicillium pulvis]KAJ5806501.1 RNA recognition motif domain eukaryote [Penicillium pulvis]